ncbi:MAG: glycosyltransferase family 2 protein [Desulfobulbaceae bacterium]|nr:glycosyltransferase family 2 protein [Desulfobulbaceae bacterium]
MMDSVDLSNMALEMDHTSPAISVITIVKNNEKLLPRAVDSVISQIFTDFEHIIVNDGSSDGTKSIIDEYAAQDDRILPVHLPRNVGRAMARNTGMDAAKGRYIFFLDSDDYLPSTALLDLYKVAEENNADIVFGRILSFNQKTGNWIFKHYTDQIVKMEQHNFRLDDHLDLVEYHHIVGRLFRQEMLERKELKFSKTRKNGEDVLFAFFTAFHARNISMVPGKIVYFYSLGNYLAAANERKLFDARDNVLDTIEYALKFGSDSLRRRMTQKGVKFAGSLERAQKVYNGNEEAIKQYLATLVPLVERITDSTLADLPPYFQKFANALKIYDFDKAYHLWAQRIKQNAHRKTNLKDKKPTQELERLKLANQQLSGQLDALYKSTSWRISAPLRRINEHIIKKVGVRSKKYTISNRKSVVIKPGLDLSLDLECGGFGKHRSGWDFALHSLKALHNPEGLYMVSFLEKIFLWGSPKPVVFPRPWIGFTHRPHNIPTWFPEDMRRLFFQNEFFPEVLSSCRGIFTLSRYHAKYLSHELPIPVESLIHPTEIPDNLWNPKVLSAQRLKLVQVGWWLRKLHGIFMLPGGDYEKIYLTKRNVEPVDRIFNIEKEYLKSRGLFVESMYDSAITVDFIPNDVYDNLLSSSIVFLDLYDSSANNAVIESIARTTPILVNPLEPVVEYLGEDYPLYYNSYEEAVEKLHDRKLLLETHEYLKNCDTRCRLSGDYFRSSLLKSEIYTKSQEYIPQQ